MSAVPPTAVLEQTINALLSDLATRSPGALDALMAAAQRDLRQIAHRERMLVGGGETLSTTALVNEAYLKLSAGQLPSAMDRRLFFGIAARAMRQILVDHARAASAAKRGGGAKHESLAAAEQQPAELARADEVLALDDALGALERANTRAAEVVQLRYFAGLGDAEIGRLLGIDESTVRRDWVKARGWLFERLGGGR
jgi:RNA polymerase sigma factor (TIGR02999 family)